jgi:hypothetical protein
LLFTFNRCPGPLCSHSTDVLVLYVHVQRMSWSFIFKFNTYPGPLCSHSTDVLVLYVHVLWMIRNYTLYSGCYHLFALNPLILPFFLITSVYQIYSCIHLLYYGIASSKGHPQAQLGSLTIFALNKSAPSELHWCLNLVCIILHFLLPNK